MRNIAKSTGMQQFSFLRCVSRHVRKGHPELSQLHNYSVQTRGLDARRNRHTYILHPISTKPPSLRTR